MHQASQDGATTGMAGSILASVAVRGARLGSVGIFAGVISGWIGFIAGGHRSDRVGADGMHWLWLFAVAFPVVLLVASWPSRFGGPIDASVRARGAVLLLAVGVIGAALGTLLDVVMTILMPTILETVGLRHLSPAGIRSGALGAFPLGALVLLCGLTVLACAVLSLAPPTRPTAAR